MPNKQSNPVSGDTVYVRDITDTWREATVRDTMSAQFTADWTTTEHGECFAFYLYANRGISWQTNKPKSLS